MPGIRMRGWRLFFTKWWGNKMISSYMAYGALSAKVRALYGKRLRFSDFEHMGSLSDAGDVLEYLRTQSGWSAAMTLLSAGSGYVGRVELEEALSLQLRQDYEGLSHFVPKRDRAILSFPVRMRELEEIMMTLRRLKSGGGRELPPVAPMAEMKVDRAALRACRDYEGLLTAVKGSGYYESLLRLKPDREGDLPDYSTAEALLQGAYYAQIYKAIHSHYAGETKKCLLRSFGQQVDLLNLIHLLRIKVYFSGELKVSDLLFSFSYKLRPEALKQLCAAGSVDEVFTLLGDTGYAKAFDGLPHTPGAVESYYYEAFYQFNKRQLSGGEPSVYTAVAYLNLKRLELRALINLIESVKYGVAYDDAFARMVGD